jgi:hypothetical protein
MAGIRVLETFADDQEMAIQQGSQCRRVESGPLAAMDPERQRLLAQGGLEASGQREERLLQYLQQRCANAGIQGDRVQPLQRPPDVLHPELGIGSGKIGAPGAKVLRGPVREAAGTGRLYGQFGQGLGHGRIQWSLGRLAWLKQFPDQNITFSSVFL